MSLVFFTQNSQTFYFDENLHIHVVLTLKEIINIDILWKSNLKPQLFITIFITPDIFLFFFYCLFTKQRNHPHRDPARAGEAVRPAHPPDV